MTITAKELRKQLSPDVAALSAKALAELDGRNVDPVTLENNAGALGVEVANPLAAQSIVLALPPSANRYWRYGPNGVHVSEEAENYKAGVKWKALHQHMTPMAGNVAVYVNVYRAQRRGDLDNYAKVLCDSLNGAAYHDDSQVAELHMWLHDDKDNPRVEVEIRRQTKGAR
jgi:Holliday junction resolvase RusA-like endonuclease